MIQFQPTPYQIINTIDRLGIKRDGSQPNHKGWLSILCPNHDDENFGSCSINLNSGFIKCFACGYGDKGNVKGIVSLVKEKLGYTFKEAKQFIEEGFYVKLDHTVIEKETKKVERKRKLYNFTSIDLNPDEWQYTKTRGFTKEFIDTFNIKHVITGWYKDYFIIPIIDNP